MRLRIRDSRNSPHLYYGVVGQVITEREDPSRLDDLDRHNIVPSRESPSGQEFAARRVPEAHPIARRRTLSSLIFDVRQVQRCRRLPSML